MQVFYKNELSDRYSGYINREWEFTPEDEILTLDKYNHISTAKPKEQLLFKDNLVMNKYAEICVFQFDKPIIKIWGNIFYIQQ
jgi:hypothetical protein